MHGIILQYQFVVFSARCLLVDINIVFFCPCPIFFSCPRHTLPPLDCPRVFMPFADRYYHSYLPHMLPFFAGSLLQAWLLRGLFFRLLAAGLSALVLTAGFTLSQCNNILALWMAPLWPGASAGRMLLLWLLRSD